MPRFTIIELTDRDLRVAHFARLGKAPLALERVLQVDLSIGEDDEDGTRRAAKVQDILKAQDRFPAADSALLVPKQHCIAREVHLPTTSADEIAGMVEFEAEKFIPFNVEQHVIGHELLRLDEMRGSDVIIAAVEQAMIRRSITIIAPGDFDPIFASVSSLSLAQGFLAQQDPAARQECICLLHLGPQHAEITLVYEGRLVITRAVAQGLQSLCDDLTEGSTPFAGVDPEVHRRLMEEMQRFGVPVAPGRQITLRDLQHVDIAEPEALTFDVGGDEDSVDTHTMTGIGNIVLAWRRKLASQLQRTYEFAQREHKLPPISRILLTGDGAMIRGMTLVLDQTFDCPVEVHNPLTAVPRSGAAAALDERHLLPFANMLGALRKLEEHIRLGEKAPTIVNLLPPEVIERQRASHRRMLLSFTAMLAVVALMIGYISWSSHNAYLDVKREQYELSILKLDATDKMLGEMQKKIQVIDSIRNEQGSAMVLLDLVSAFPNIGPRDRSGRIVLSEFKFEAGRSVTIVGDAMILEDVTSFAAYLTALEMGGRRIFSNVELRSHQPTNLSRREDKIIRYTIICTLNQNTRERSS